MSKPVVRILLTVLISLAILAGIYTTVYGAAFHAGVLAGRAQVTAGLLPDLSHTRVQASTVSGYYTGLTQQKQQHQGHDCSGDFYSNMDE